MGASIQKCLETRSSWNVENYLKKKHQNIWLREELKQVHRFSFGKMRNRPALILLETWQPIRPSPISFPHMSTPCPLLLTHPSILIINFLSTWFVFFDKCFDSNMKLLLHPLFRTFFILAMSRSSLSSLLSSSLIKWKYNKSLGCWPIDWTRKNQLFKLWTCLKSSVHKTA